MIKIYRRAGKAKKSEINAYIYKYQVNNDCNYPKKECSMYCCLKLNIWCLRASCVAVCYLNPFWVILSWSYICFVGLTSWIKKPQKNYMKEDSVTRYKIFIPRWEFIFHTCQNRAAWYLIPRRISPSSESFLGYIGTGILCGG